MDIDVARRIIGNDDLSDDDVSALLLRAQKLAKNQHYWKPDDDPEKVELERFYERYEYEIYDIAKEVYSSNSRGGLKEFSELGVTRKWGGSGSETVSLALAAIPPKTYVV